MNNGYEPSEKRFYRIIFYTLIMSVLLIIVLSIIFPAPLQEQASRSVVPNPAKSAWFLLWIQELVSYRVWYIYPLLGAGVLILFLPWFMRKPVVKASWFGREHRIIACCVMMMVMGVLVLTSIAYWFRGINWSFVLPWQ